MKRLRSRPVWIAAALLVATVAYFALRGGDDRTTLRYDELLARVDAGEVSTIELSGSHASGTLRGGTKFSATNRPDILDPALLRPGRFDRHVVVDRPDRKGRVEIFLVQSRGKPLDPNVSLDLVARRTPGFTGADLANVLNEAALLAARRGAATIGSADIADAIDRVVAGPDTQGVDHRPWSCSGVDPVPSCRRPLHADSQRAARHPVVPVGWAHRRGTDLRGPHHRGSQRHRARQRHRTGHGDRVRDERCAGTPMADPAR